MHTANMRAENVIEAWVVMILNRDSVPSMVRYIAWLRIIGTKSKKAFWFERGKDSTMRTNPPKTKKIIPKPANHEHQTRYVGIFMVPRRGPRNTAGISRYHRIYRLNRILLMVKRFSFMSLVFFAWKNLLTDAS